MYATLCVGESRTKKERNSQRFAISNLRPSEKISSAVFFSLSFSIQIVILFMTVGHTWRLRVHVDDELGYRLLTCNAITNDPSMISFRVERRCMYASCYRVYSLTPYSGDELEPRENEVYVHTDTRSRCVCVLTVCTSRAQNRLRPDILTYF